MSCLKNADVINVDLISKKNPQNSDVIMQISCLNNTDVIM